MSLLVLPGHERLDRVLAGNDLLDSLHAGAEVRAWVAGEIDDPLGSRTGAAAEVNDALLDAYGRGDELSRILLLPALALVPGPAADALLRSALEGDNAALREHAAWALGDRAPLPAALPGLDALRAAGGFEGMLAELTLDRWSAAAAPSPAPSGPEAARRAPARSSRPAGRGLRIVQVFMQGFLDAGLSRAGAGDGGGLATLLVHLSGALAARPEVERVTTLTRAFGGDGVPAVHGTAFERVADGAAIERIPFGGEGYLATADMWTHRRELERGLEAALRRLAPVDAVHLRFADVATLAAARVCERLGLPVYFTLAPDPHALIQRREASGALDRESFVAADRLEHLLFRARLVERMRDDARGLALLPRTSAREVLEELVRLPASDGGRRVRTVAEGISMASVDAAAREVALSAARPGPDPGDARAASPAVDAEATRLGPGPRGRRCRRPRRVARGRPRRAGPRAARRAARAAADPLRRPSAPRQGVRDAARGVGGRAGAARRVQPCDRWR